MKYIRIFISAVLAGICISIGGTVFLSLESKVIGAFLFTIGLFAICTNGLHLFTGKICYIFENGKDYLRTIPVIWLGNLVGTFCSAAVLCMTRIGSAITEKAASICQIKLNDSVGSILVLSFFCNILIYIAVDGFKNNPHEVGKYLALFFGVVVFILCGFEHCVANMFYISVAKAWSARAFYYLLIMTVGNGLGGVFVPLMKKIITDKQ